MNKDELLNDLKNRGFDSYFVSGGRRSYFLFETLVLKLLTKHLEDQDKPLFANYKIGGRELDGYAPEGLDDLEAPTLIEIKALKSPNLNFVRSMLDEILAKAVTSNCKSVLLIVGSRLTSRERQRINRYINLWPKGLTAKVWYSEEVVELLEKYVEFVSDIIPELSELAVSNVVRKSLSVTQDDWRRTRDRYIEQLRASYSANDLALFLGAGISKKAGVPDWQSLISSLLVALIGERLPATLGTTDDEKNVIASHIQEIHGFAPLLETRYIRRGLGETFGQTVAKYLYEGIGSDGGGTSETLQAVAQLCIPPEVVQVLGL